MEGRPHTTGARPYGRSSAGGKQSEHYRIKQLVKNGQVTRRRVVVKLKIKTYTTYGELPKVIRSPECVGLHVSKLCFLFEQHSFMSGVCIHELV